MFHLLILLILFAHNSLAFRLYDEVDGMYIMQICYKNLYAHNGPVLWAVLNLDT